MKVTHLTREDILFGKLSPQGHVVPEFVGQNYITETGVLYVATDLTVQGWKLLAGAQQNSPVYVGSEEPKDTGVVWIDTDDENGAEILADQVLLQEIGKAICNIREQVKDIHFAFTDKLDSGTFTEKENEDEDAPEFESRNIKHICIKRGKKVDLPPLKDGEFAYCTDTKQLYIGNNGKYDLIGSIGGSSDSSGGVLTGEYIELVSPNKTAYRIAVTDDGKLDIYNASIDTIPDPDISESARFKGLIINKMYGGGAINTNSTPVSHGFIELYNTTDNPINLKGLSLQYKEQAMTWKCLQLRGIVPPQSSFVIRGAQHSDPKLESVRCKVDKYDMTWDIPFTDKGFSAYLTVGRNTIGVDNPFYTGSNNLKLEGYIDLLGCGGEDVTRVVDAYETRFAHLMSKTKAVIRKDFADRDDNFKDVKAIDFSTCDVDIYGPRTSDYGKWDVHFDKIKLDPNEPNMINICFGKQGDSTRTFTWQTEPTTLGFLRYRKKDVRTDGGFTQVPTSKRPIQNLDQDGTVHSVVIKNLTPGIYEYQAGEEGKWTDIYEFEVKDYSDYAPMKFLQVTDQQGWDEYEYHAWKKAVEYIEANEEYDFIINTGDISQNGNRAFEWRYYYHFAKNFTRTNVHMLTLGNNDMVKTVKPPDSTPFTYYGTFEDSPYTSCYSYDVGMVHFVCLNSEELYSEQIEWLKEDLSNTQQHWVIVHMHISPYTVLKTAKVQVFKEVFEDYGVHLVICGHNHAYSRSHPMYKDQVNPDLGVVYTMSQATGYKLEGRSKPQEVLPEYSAHAELPSQPSYMTYEITKDKIIVKSYRIDNILPTELDNGALAKFMFDSTEIPHKDRRNLVNVN